ncbi:RsmB/NOP family class I SAM-dependent RNA methyltransferase [Paracoccus pacificus]|uniref:RsmB/NOP family class I SAM-dependent RNA methyltransferase n=1 Tax=Paracoccus pacificus TaxID=1463598 RepID=A0ABW4RAX8_9RHOB
MTPGARVAAAIEVLDRVIAGAPAEQALIQWARASRFAGSGDRTAVRDLVFDSLRRLHSRAALGGGLTGRGVMIGRCREEGIDPDTVFTGLGHAPPPLDDAERAAPPPGDAAGDAVEDAAGLDVPGWLVPALQSALGDDYTPVMAAMRERAPVWLRINPKRAAPDLTDALADAGIQTRPVSGLPQALQVVQGERGIARSTPFLSGQVELQDLSSQIAAAALPVQAGDRVLDYCAGGGGKTLAMAAVTDAHFDAHDVTPSRMADLPARAARAGARVRILQPGKAEGPYDLVVVDAPCSGSGTWRRTPDAKWRLTPDRLAGITALQAEILDRAQALVRPGGHLAYLTCSLLGAENDAQIDAFLKRFPGFTVEHRQLLTPLDASDGFFYAVMRKNG